MQPISLEQILRQRSDLKALILEKLDHFFNDLGIPLHMKMFIVSQQSQENEDLINTPVDDRHFKQKMLRIIDPIGDRTFYLQEYLQAQTRTIELIEEIYRDNRPPGTEWSDSDLSLVSLAKKRKGELEHEKKNWDELLEVYADRLSIIDVEKEALMNIALTLIDDDLVAELVGNSNAIVIGG